MMIQKFVGDYGAAASIDQSRILVVGRMVSDFDAQGQRGRGQTPLEASVEFFNSQLNTYKANPHIRVWEGHNEPVWADADGMAWYSNFCIELMRLFEAQNLKCVIGNFSTGTPPLELWPAFLPACRFAMQNGHYLGLHEYGACFMWDLCNDKTSDGRVSGWTVLRYRKVYDQFMLPNRLGDLKLIITECGLDPATQGNPAWPSGTFKQLGDFWARGPNAWGPLPKDYVPGEGYTYTDRDKFFVQQLQWYDFHLREDQFVVGACLFTSGSWAGAWRDFDINGTQVPGLLAKHIRASHSNVPSNRLDVPWLSQLGQQAAYAPGDCGAASLAMVLRFKGKACSVDDVSKATGLPPGYTTATWSNLIKAGQVFGFDFAREVNVSLDKVRAALKNGNPVVALVNYKLLAKRYDKNYPRGHFVVIVGCDESTVVYHDPYWPTAGDGAFIACPIATFEEAWATPAPGNSFGKQAMFLLGPYAPINTVGRGVQMRADGHSRQADFIALGVAKMNWAKVMSNTPTSEIYEIISRGIKPENILLRMMGGFDGRVVSPQEFFNWHVDWLAAFAAAGGRYVEIHNEPNLPPEGFGTCWKSPAEFSAWYSQVVALIRQNFSSLLCGFPGLSPKPEVSDWLAVCKPAIQASDFVCVHCYWLTEEQLSSQEHGHYFKRYEHFGVPIIISEFSNPSRETPKAKKGLQYRQYYSMLPNTVKAAIGFIVSASSPDFASETWVDERGALTDIPKVLGG